MGVGTLGNDLAIAVSKVDDITANGAILDKKTLAIIIGLILHNFFHEFKLSNTDQAALQPAIMMGANVNISKFFAKR